MSCVSSSFPTSLGDYGETALFLYYEHGCHNKKADEYYERLWAARDEAGEWSLGRDEL